ncbi:MAG: DUF4387 family protein [Burkholderiaceae bacterium]
MTNALPPARTLVDLAQVIRSKNAGPTQLTIDVFLRDADAYATCAASPAMGCAAVALRYGLQADQVQRHLLAHIHAIKYVMPRALVAGSPGDGDVYGAQQHGPMLEIVP